MAELRVDPPGIIASDVVVQDEHMASSSSDDDEVRTSKRSFEAAMARFVGMSDDEKDGNDDDEKDSTPDLK